MAKKKVAKSTKTAKQAKGTRKPKVAIPPESEVAEKRYLEGDSAIAKHYDVSERTIQSWRKKGMPFDKIKPNFYKYDLDLTDEWVDVFRRKYSGVEGNAQLRIELDQVKLRIDIAKAEKLEREEEEARGNILRKDEWESFAIELIQVCRGQILQLPKQMRRHLCGKCQKTAPIELDKLVNKVLHKLGRMREGPRKE